MIYSAQLSGSTEICELVKQRSSTVNHKAITAFLTYKGSEEWPKGALNDALRFKNDLSNLDWTLYITCREHHREEAKLATFQQHVVFFWLSFQSLLLCF